MAQLVAHLHGMERVRGSNPLSSTEQNAPPSGRGVSCFSSLYPQARILGIDSSPDMIASARKLHPDCDFDVLDAGSLDELDTGFDVVFSNACLQWVPNHERVLPSMLRRLNAGGVAAAQFTENINLPRTSSCARPRASRNGGSGSARYAATAISAATIST